MNKSIILAIPLALVLASCGSGQKPTVPAATAPMIAPTPAPAPVPLTATDAKPDSSK